MNKILIVHTSWYSEHIAEMMNIATTVISDNEYEYITVCAPGAIERSIAPGAQTVIYSYSLSEMTVVAIFIISAICSLYHEVCTIKILFIDETCYLNIET